MYAPDAPAMPAEETLILNTGCEIIRRLAEDDYGEQTDAVKKQVYSLALLAQKKLSAEELRSFLTESFALLRTL